MSEYNVYEYKKSMCVAYVLWFFLGLFGGHRFYLRRWCTAVLWLLTLGVFGLGWLIDACVLPRMISDYNGNFYKDDLHAMASMSGTFGPSFAINRFRSSEPHQASPSIPVPVNVPTKKGSASSPNEVIYI